MVAGVAGGRRVPAGYDAGTYPIAAPYRPEAMPSHLMHAIAEVEAAGGQIEPSLRRSRRVSSHSKLSEAREWIGRTFNRPSSPSAALKLRGAEPFVPAPARVCRADNRR